MKFWLSKNSEISIREQLTRQIVLAIVSGDLKAGERLPSVRELALRHKIHANTASAAYRSLEETGWVEARVGSGVYVRAVTPLQIAETTRAIESELDKLILSFLNEARQRGFDRLQLKTRLNFWLESRGRRQKIIIVENDAELARILAHELSAHFAAPISVVDFAAAEKDGFGKNSLVVSLADFAENVPAPAFVKLKLNSVQVSLRGQVKPDDADLIGLASHWEKFLRWSQTMLAAVGIDEENLVVRDARQTDWEKGLNACRFVISDSLSAERLPDGVNKRVFKLISAESIAEMQNLLQ